MCGIVGIFKIKQQTQELRQKALKMSQKLRHRGPDWNGIYVGGSAILAHERLSIVDPQSGGPTSKCWKLGSVLRWGKEKLTGRTCGVCSAIRFKRYGKLSEQ